MAMSFGRPFTEPIRLQRTKARIFFEAPDLYRREAVNGSQSAEW